MQGWIKNDGTVITATKEMHAAAAKKALGITDNDAKAICKLALAAGWILFRVESGCASVDYAPKAERSAKSLTALRRVIGRSGRIYGDCAMWDDVASLIDDIRAGR